MEYIKKIRTHMLFAAVAVAVLLVLFGISGQTYAAVDDTADGVYFEESYAVEGKTLTVKYDGSESNLSYKWFIDGESISDEEDGVLDITKDYYQKTIKAEVWSGEAKLGEASLFCSKLPVLYIDTEGGAEIVTKDYYIDAQMHLQGNDIYNTGNTTLYTGATEIKGRGNSTWKLFPKKPYKLKLDKKTSLFDMGKNKHWILLANYIDESCMRNMLAGDIASNMNVGAMDSVWVEVVLNGESQGIYMLCEQIRLSKDRVNIFDWENAGEDIAEAIAEKNGFSEADMDALTTQMVEEDMSWISKGEVTYNGITYKTAEYYENLPESFSGGYLIEMDFGYDEVSKFTTTNGAMLMFKNPEFIYTDETAMNSAKSYIQAFEDALYSKDFCTESAGKIVSYTELCDIDSFASFWLASEMLMNEVGCKSTYFQKDINQPIIFGPVWDFDFSSGSVSPFSAQNSTDWTSDNKYWGGSEEKWWVGQVMKDPYFAVKLRNVFLEQEDYLKSVVADGGLLDDWYDYIKESGEYNYELWQYARGFNADYEALDSWLTERINWMDKQFATNESVMKSMGITFSDKFELELKGESVSLNSGKSYSAEVGSSNFDLSVSVNEGEYPELNYYINGKYQGTVAVTDGKVDIVVGEDQLTEDIGDDNVITVWLKDKDGNLSEQQYLTVKMLSDKALCNIVFNDGTGGTYSVKAAAGERIYIDGPQNQDSMTVFEGWSDGNNVYTEGTRITVKADMTLNAVWVLCSDGGYIHDFADKEDKNTCIKDNCNVTKASEKSYTKISACALTCSNRYDNYYTGNEIKPVITVSDGDKELVEGTHYTIEFKNTVNAGYGIYTIKGIKSAGYSGEVTLSYRIIPRSILKTDIAVTSVRVLENGIAKPEVTITYKGKTLTEGADYNLSYEKNDKVGTAALNITGTGNFTGTVTKNFNVIDEPVSMNKCSFGISSTYAYTGKAVKPAFSVKEGNRKLVEGINYTAKYSNNTKCGTATVKITGIEKNGYKGTVTKTFKIRPAKTTPKVVNVKYNEQKVTWSKVTGATKYYVYKSTNNKSYKLVKTVKSSSSRVYKSKGLDAGNTYYYKVRAVREQKVNGKTVKYWGIKSSEVKEKTVLYKGNIKSIKNTSSRTATIKWTAANGAHGYKLYRSTSGKTGSFKLIKNVKTGSQYKDKKLKKGKTYYYKVKPYRNVNGKMVYGNISKVKSIKITR